MTTIGSDPKVMTRGDKIVGWVCVVIALLLLTGVVV